MGQRRRRHGASSEAAAVIVSSRGAQGGRFIAPGLPPRVPRESKSCGFSDDVTAANEGVWMDISHGGTKDSAAGPPGAGGKEMKSDPITEVERSVSVQGVRREEVRWK